MEQLLLDLAQIRHRLEVLVQTRRVVGLTADEQAEFERLAVREAELLQLVRDGEAPTADGPDPPPPA
jgi:hypothetical protein